MMILALNITYLSGPEINVTSSSTIVDFGGGICVSYLLMAWPKLRKCATPTKFRFLLVKSGLAQIVFSCSHNTFGSFLLVEPAADETVRV